MLKSASRPATGFDMSAEEATIPPHQTKALQADHGDKLETQRRSATGSNCYRIITVHCNNPLRNFSCNTSEIYALELRHQPAKYPLLSARSLKSHYKPRSRCPPRRDRDPIAAHRDRADLRAVHGQKVRADEDRVGRGVRTARPRRRAPRRDGGARQGARRARPDAERASPLREIARRSLSGGFYMPT